MQYPTSLAQYPVQSTRSVALTGTITGYTDATTIAAQVLTATAINAVGAVTYAWTIYGPTDPDAEVLIVPDEAATRLSPVTAQSPTWTPNRGGVWAGFCRITDALGYVDIPFRVKVGRPGWIRLIPSQAAASYNQDGVTVATDDGTATTLGYAGGVGEEADVGSLPCGYWEYPAVDADGAAITYSIVTAWLIEMRIRFTTPPTVNGGLTVLIGFTNNTGGVEWVGLQVLATNATDYLLRSGGNGSVTTSAAAPMTTLYGHALVMPQVVGGAPRCNLVDGAFIADSGAALYRGATQLRVTPAPTVADGTPIKMVMGVGSDKAETDDSCEGIFEYKITPILTA